MLIFKNYYSYTNPLSIVFLCGSKYSSSSNDKRNVLKQYIENNFPNMRAVILEEHFIFARTNMKYLSYDDIYLKDLAQVEQLASLYSDRIIIIHETISTAAEIGMFASNPSLAGKVCMLVSDPLAIEGDKTGSFIKLSFLNKRSPHPSVKLIRYYPDIEIYRFSENKSDYHTYFHNNKIGDCLAKEISSFITPNITTKNIVFRKKVYGKATNSSEIVDYSISDEKGSVFLDLHIDTLKIQLLSILFLDEIRRELRKAKSIQKHVLYLLKIFQSLLLNTVSEIEGKNLNEYTAKINIKDSSCEIKQAIGYFLYMLQAAKIIGMEQKYDEKPEVRKIRFSTVLDQYKDQFIHLILDSGTTEFGRLTT